MSHCESLTSQLSRSHSKDDVHYLLCEEMQLSIIDKPVSISKGVTLNYHINGRLRLYCVIQTCCLENIQRSVKKQLSVSKDCINMFT